MEREEIVIKKTEDVDSYLSAKKLEVLKTFHRSSIIMPHTLFEYLLVDNQFTAFPNRILL